MRWCMCSPLVGVETGQETTIIDRSDGMTTRQFCGVTGLCAENGLYRQCVFHHDHVVVGSTLDACTVAVDMQTHALWRVVGSVCRQLRDATHCFVLDDGALLHGGHRRVTGILDGGGYVADADSQRGYLVSESGKLQLFDWVAERVVLSVAGVASALRCEHDSTIALRCREGVCIFDKRCHPIGFTNTCFTGRTLMLTDTQLILLQTTGGDRPVVVCVDLRTTKPLFSVDVPQSAELRVHNSRLFAYQTNSFAFPKCVSLDSSGFWVKATNLMG